jgi:hypothetical protein
MLRDGDTTGANHPQRMVMITIAGVKERTTMMKDEQDKELDMGNN